MFDFENPFKVAADIAAAAEQVEELTACDHESSYLDPEWEDITAAHATAEERSGRADVRANPDVAADRIYRKVHKKHKERTAITALRYAVVSIGLTAVGWIARDITWLAITLGVIALYCGLIAAYGAGKCREM